MYEQDTLNENNFLTVLRLKKIRIAQALVRDMTNRRAIGYHVREIKLAILT